MQSRGIKNLTLSKAPNGKARGSLGKIYKIQEKMIKSELIIHLTF